MKINEIKKIVLITLDYHIRSILTLNYFGWNIAYFILLHYPFFYPFVYVLYSNLTNSLFKDKLDIVEEMIMCSRIKN